MISSFETISPSLDQSPKNVERARPDRDRDEGALVVAPEQPTAKAVEPKLLE